MAWIGGIALIPATVIAMPGMNWESRQQLSGNLLFLGKGLGLLLPLLLALRLRGKAAWLNGVAALWVIVLSFIPYRSTILPYVWCALAALALIAWGLEEAQRERINLGILGFGLTVVVFYFSNVMDKLGRSASLIGMGVLFIVLGWALERTRRKLVARVMRKTA
jgi:hypothetical protein